MHFGSRLQGAFSRDSSGNPCRSRPISLLATCALQLRMTQSRGSSSTDSVLGWCHWGRDTVCMTRRFLMKNTLDIVFCCLMVRVPGISYFTSKSSEAQYQHTVSHTEESREDFDQGTKSIHSPMASPPRPIQSSLASLTVGIPLVPL
jgi:hypothetical protein